MTFGRRLEDLIHRETPGGASGGGGGAPPAPPTPPNPPAPQATAGATAPAPVPAPTGQPPAAPPVAPTYEQWLADPVNAGFTKKLRDEAAGARVKARDQVAALARELGVEIPGGAGNAPTDPNAVLATLVERDKKREGELRELKIDNHLKDLYIKHGVHPQLTRGQLMLNGTLAGLDPDKEDFASTLDGAVKKIAEQVPQVKIAAPPPAPPKRTGAPMPPNGAPVQLTKEDIKGMKPEEVLKAQQAGQLDELLGRRS